MAGKPRPGGDIALALGVARRMIEAGSTDPRAADYCDQFDAFEALVRSRPVDQWAALAGVPIEFAWSGRMGFTRSKMPLVRQLSPGFWVATGFGGHGLNTTAMAGEMVAAAIARGTAPCARRWPRQACCPAPS
jgi:glycine/D-amino acid oxidase-like deaminating enzyme